jgi:cytochrome c oxidase cbb3-type subunit 3
MKRPFIHLMLVLGLLLLAASSVYAQATEPQTASISPDSAMRYCKEVFQKNCSGCHGEKGQGTVGPNLTDKFWIHGGGTKNVAGTIKEGVSGKGMIGWDAVFSAEELHRIAECVMMLQGTDPPKAKKPEGEPAPERKN